MRAIDGLVNVDFGDVAKQPEYMVRVKEDYFKGGDTGSSMEMRRAFHPATMMFFVDKEGALTGVSMPLGAVITVQTIAITTVCTTASPKAFVSRDQSPRPMMCKA